MCAFIITAVIYKQQTEVTTQNSYTWHVRMVGIYVAFLYVSKTTIIRYITL